MIHSVLQKYRKDGGDIIHIRHVTPEGAPLFTKGSGLDEEFEELREGMGEREKVRVGGFEGGKGWFVWLIR